MYARHSIREDQWKRIEGFFSQGSGRGRPATPALFVVNAILWILVTAQVPVGPGLVPGRNDAPIGGGRAPTLRVPGQLRILHTGAPWKAIFEDLVKNADGESFMIDATIVRAHQDAAGARTLEGPQAIGQSRGGPTTKIHAVVDALGNPIRIELTEGQVHDVTRASSLITGFEGANILADKGYDADALIQQIESQGCIPVIPSKRNRTKIRPYDRDTYKERHLVENFFQKIKRFRRVAMRFEKLATRFLAMVHLASIMVWIA